jgi:phosphopentomutase
MISYYAMGFAIEAFTNTVLNHLCGKKIFLRMMRVGYAPDVIAKMTAWTCLMIL